MYVLEILEVGDVDFGDICKILDVDVGREFNVGDVDVSYILLLIVGVVISVYKINYGYFIVILLFV